VTDRSPPFLRWATVLVVTLLVATLLVGRLTWEFEQPGPASTETTIVIPRGATLTAAAGLLADRKVITDKRRFLRLARWLGDRRPIMAGEFDIPAHASMARVLSILQTGVAVLHSITIVEGMSVAQVHDRLMAEPLLKGSISIPEEGSVLPDTYSFGRGESREAVLARMQDAMAEALATLWESRAPNLPLASPRDAVILASIVEKETARKKELPLVAGVYINRLTQGIRLQADPTVIYPITRGRPLGRRIRKSELEADNPYNTYVIAGLPAGPIANPSRRALEATLNPARTDALFFVADGSGGHRFSETLAEHERNVANWRRYRATSGK